MATVQILMNGQITLPVNIRRALKLQQGSFLDIQLKDNEIVLVPKILVDEAEIIRNASLATANIREKNKDISSEQIEKDIAEAIKAIRAEN